MIIITIYIIVIIIIININIVNINIINNKNHNHNNNNSNSHNKNTNNHIKTTKLTWSSDNFTKQNNLYVYVLILWCSISSYLPPHQHEAKNIDFDINNININRSFVKIINP